jgi:hypothetical protein
MKGDIVNCANCGIPFEQRRRDDLFHSRQCRFDHWAKTHPRVQIGKRFKIVLAESGEEKA